LLAGHRQIADFVDNQQPVCIDRAMHDLAIAALALRRLQHQHQIGCAEEASRVALVGGEIAERNRKMGLPTPEGPRNTRFSSRSNEGETCELHDLLARRAVGEVEVVLIECLDRREAGQRSHRDL